MIGIDYEAEKKLDIPYEKIITEVAKDALDYKNCPYEMEINAVLTDSEGIRQMNLEAKNTDAVTDILSFLMIDYEVASDFEHVEESAKDYFSLETGEPILGDIMISVDEAEEQAGKYGYSMSREPVLLVAHSTLHLRDYDHTVEEERLEVGQKRDEILERREYRR